MKNFALFLFCALLCSTTLHAQNSGVTGALAWAITGNKLTITGIGAMPNYEAGKAPWYASRANITKVVIGNATSIGNYAFYGFMKLNEVTISAKVTSIGDYAFANCIALESVTIPEKVSSIGNNAFAGSGLKTVNVQRGAPATLAGNNVFPKNRATLFVPEGTESTYSTGWKGYFVKVVSPTAAAEVAEVPAIKVIEATVAETPKVATVELAEKKVEEAPVTGQQENGETTSVPAIQEIDYFKENLSAAYENALLFQNVKSDWAKLGLRGKVKSVQEEGKNNYKFNVFFNGNGQITRMERPSQSTKTFAYTNGQLTKITETAGGKTTTKDIRYNNKGQITSEEPSVNYASNGLAVKVGYSTNGPVVWKWRTLEFDEKTGLLKKEIPETSDGIEIVYEYDENGRCTKRTTWVWEDEAEYIKRVHECMFTYNDKNDIVKKACTCKKVYEFSESTKCPPENVSYTYTCDAHGNWTVCSDGRKRKIEYYGEMAINSKNKPDAPGWFDGMIKGKIEGTGNNIEAYFSGVYGQMDIILDKVAVVEKQFALKLPEIEDDMLFMWSQVGIFSGVLDNVKVIPNELRLRSAQFRIPGAGFTVTRHLGCYDASGEISVTIHYADREAVITGSMGVTKFDLKLAKGWNVVVHKDRRASQAFEIKIYATSEPVPQNTVWK